MEWTQDQISAVIGAKELEIIGLRMELARALTKIKEMEDAAKPDGGRPKVELAAVESGLDKR
jgi:hypothetical protein